MEGMLKITKIDLYVPILAGATDENLNYYCIQFVNTGKVRQV